MRRPERHPASHQEHGITAGAVTTCGYDSLKRVVSAIEKSGAKTTASWACTYDEAEKVRLD
ncbi:hypothetical protein GCM10027056_15960 [Glaciibacter psychrotolerans]